MIEKFKSAMRASGIEPPQIVADGKLHRFNANGKAKDDSGWYVLHLDGIPAGQFGSWITGFSQTWADKSRKSTREEQVKQMARNMDMQRQRDEEEAKGHEAAAKQAGALWGAATPVVDHPYLTRKGVQAHGLRADGDTLLVPMRDTAGKLWNVERITPDGEKRGLYRGKRTGCYFAIGNPDGTICVCEGFATGASIHEATGLAVAVALNAGNLPAAAKTLRAKFPDLTMVVCGDDDYRTDGNPGKTKAAEAALSVGGISVLPIFTDRPDGATDFNDLHQSEGVEAVRRIVLGVPEARPEQENASTGPEMASTGIPEAEIDQPSGETTDGPTGGNDWPEPQPLSAKIEPEPYPLDALPDTIRNAVEEVGGFVKAPLPLVASSALAALSLACQAHIDVERAGKLLGPVSLYFLSIAGSGERKSTCDGFFTSAIRQYQDEQAETAKPAVKAHQAAIAAWEAERDGILMAIKMASKGGKATEQLKRDLAGLQNDRPEPPRVPRLILGDETPENLAYGLAKQWPSSGVMSSEAGTVFGSHGMSSESVMRNLSLLNVLWDGGVHSVGRRTSESFTVRGARLTMGLMVQEATLREFAGKTGGLARGIGYFARNLVAWPESTQGQRPFTEAPAHWPHLAAFHRRVAAILNQDVSIDEDGALTPTLLSLTPKAKAAWVEYHDAIEGELASGGDLYDVRDVASKSADNAARLAALFHMFERGDGAISLEAFEGASRIAAWHLSEAQRFFGELALPAELADAARLDSWLIEHCRRERTHMVSTRDAQRLGPVRSKEKLTAALRELAELDRLQVRKDGKRLTIHLNPALVGVP